MSATLRGGAAHRGQGVPRARARAGWPSGSGATPSWSAGRTCIAGTDCGYGTWVGQAAVDPGVVWAKLGSLSEGARLASREFWP